MSLTLIIGSMFSGKTTELQRLIHREQCIGRRVLVINHSFDKERADDMTTHAGQSMKCVSLGYLGDIDTSGDDFREYDTIAINEGQFFEDLEPEVLKLLNTFGKNVFVSALDSDFKTQPFANVMKLIPHANKLMKLHALCMKCANGTPALYSYRKTGDTSTIAVGGADMYMPLCRKCYHSAEHSLYKYIAEHAYTNASEGEEQELI